MTKRPASHVRGAARRDRSHSGPDAETAARAVPAVTRGIAILRLLARSHAPMGVNAIARALDMVPSTCLHILRALVAEELVSVDAATKQYRLDAGVLTLARSALRQDSFARLAQPEIDAVAAAFGTTTIGVRVIDLRHMIVVALSRSEATFRLHVDIGSRFPALISATGRCLAAFGSHADREIEQAFRKLRWDAAPLYADWLAEVGETRRAGYGLDNGNYIRGVMIVAAPVMRLEGDMTHALAAVGLTEQMRATGPVSLGEELRAAAHRLTAQLGGASHSEGAGMPGRRPGR